MTISYSSFHHHQSTHRYLLVLLLTLLSTPQPTLAQECAVNLNNDKDTCAALIATTEEDCDCYTFCDDQVVGCNGWDEVVDFQCVGQTVGGCRKDMAQDTSTPPTSSCAVTVNAQDSICHEFLSALESTVQCECYNFCNGKLIGCLDYGERNSFKCSGETVAGCTSEQRTSQDISGGYHCCYSTTIGGMIMALVALWMM